VSFTVAFDGVGYVCRGVVFPKRTNEHTHTATGGTRFTNKPNVFCGSIEKSVYAWCEERGEVASTKGEQSLIDTGGGFSRVVKRPSYQPDAMLDGYLNSPEMKALPSNVVDRKGRGVPDVSIVAMDYIVYQEGRGVYPSGGTSASAPVYAGMIALLNDVLLRSGKPRLGFMVCLRCTGW